MEKIKKNKSLEKVLADYTPSLFYRMEKLIKASEGIVKAELSDIYKNLKDAV